MSDQITSIASQDNMQVLPWPVNINMVSEDPDTVIVFINNDIENIIVSIKVIEPDVNN